jgi:hypothetical protein
MESIAAWAIALLSVISIIPCYFFTRYPLCYIDLAEVNLILNADLST